MTGLWAICLLETSRAAAWLPCSICALAIAAGIVQYLVYRRRLCRLVRYAEAEAARLLERDALTGLRSRIALDRRLAKDERESGVVAVADLDEFKRLNESLGHLGGDEILRGIGRLLRHSIRPEDAAYRWGGDEFVIVFRNVNIERARERMREIEERLRHFHIRNYGEVSIEWSWGLAETGQRSLRNSLDEADRAMYATKRGRSSPRV